MWADSIGVSPHSFKENTMAFLKDNEHIIFMDMCTKYEYPKVRLPEDDIKKLVDAGITTCMSFGTHWDWIEPQKGIYDWSYYDDRIRLLNDCGMKVLFHAQSYFPSWLPESWRLKTQNGNSELVVSPWNDEAWEYTKDYYRKVRDRYNSDMVLVTSSWLADGETLMPITLACFDDFAIQKYRQQYGDAIPKSGDPQTHEFLIAAYKKMFCDLQSIMSENRFGEIWTSLHPATAWNVPSTQNAIEETLSLFHLQKPDIIINHLYCTWCQWQHFFPVINRWGKQFGNVFGGAEYHTGIVDNTKLALSNGVRGLLYGPCHPYTGYSRIEDCMIDSAKESMALWQQIGNAR